MTEYKPKLIEVALPLAAINAAAAKDGSIGQRPHPKNLHRWWARRPLAAVRAVLWASLVDDPSGDDSLTEEQQAKERRRLFEILEELVTWNATGDQAVLARAKAEIDRCYPDGPPPVLDPFGGGGAIPLEAQRLGLTALAGDLNPVAVLIQRAMIEIPPRFAGKPAVHPNVDERTTWHGTEGLAADIETYGRWMRDEAERRIGHLYPDATGPDGEKLTPVAWIWARTVESPDPSWKGHVPLVASWTLSNKKGKPPVWIEPIVDRETQSISYEVRTGGKPTANRTVSRGNATCLATGSAIKLTYIDDAATAGQLGQDLMAVVCEGPYGRVYVTPDAGQREALKSVPTKTELGETTELPSGKTRGTFGSNAQGRYYGFFDFADYFSPRQLVALTAFSDLLGELHDRVVADATAVGMADDGQRLRDSGHDAAAYADALVTYLAFVIDRMADFGSTICTWNAPNEQLRYTFRDKSIPMTWDYAEINPFSDLMASWMSHVQGVSKAVATCLAISADQPAPEGSAKQMDAVSPSTYAQPGALISTDPPYYDNVSYADLSDFFYVWMRRNLADVWPEETATLLTPKSAELIANRYRAGSKDAAEEHFESGMSDFMKQVAQAQPEGVPATIYYAYMATENRDGDVVSTGWATFLQAILDAGLQVAATWPLRTERKGRLAAIGANALASSIVLSCRRRVESAPLASRAEFVAALRTELPAAVRLLQSGNIAPVDLPQSTIGPGIKVFSRYAKVVEADGSRMRVSTALGIINDVLAEVLDEEEGELDADSRFAVAWYSQHGWDPADSGDADGLARAKNTSLDGLRQAGIGDARGGKFRLYQREELKPDWTPQSDDRLTVWEATQYLAAALQHSESEAAELLRRLGGIADRARALAYVLFQRATDNGWAEEATVYNGLVTAWSELQSQAARAAEVAATPRQQTLL